MDERHVLLITQNTQVIKVMPSPYKKIPETSPGQPTKNKDIACMKKQPTYNTKKIIG